MEKGILYGVGVGPGDPELMTLKAVKTALNADVLAIPRKDAEKCTALKIALGAAPALAEKPLLPLHMPMTKEQTALEAGYAAAVASLERELDAGRSVCFLTLGDPTVYSTYMYLHQRVADDGYRTEIVPGVTSFCAAAAALGIPLCENREQLHIIPGTYTPTQALDLPGVKVLMKNNLPATLPVLEKQDKDVWMVENCGMENQRIFRGAAQIPEDAGYFSLLIVKDKP